MTEEFLKTNFAPAKNLEKNIKEGVDFVFEQNPELARIGTKEQYSEYLDAVFPESKIKDIVYHSSKKEGLEKMTTISNWTPRGSSKFIVKQEVSKGLYVSRSRYFLEDFKKGNVVKKDYQLLINVLSPDYREGIVNSNDIEISKVEKIQEQGFDSIISDEGGEKNTIIIFEPEQIHILGSKKDLSDFENFIQGRQV